MDERHDIFERGSLKCVYEASVEGKFVVQCSGKKFSLMALVESQEHSIEFLKEESGIKAFKGVVSMDNKRKRLLNSPKLRLWGSWRNLTMPNSLYQKSMSASNIQNPLLLNRKSSCMI
jgi:hypothetical protein